MMSLIICGFTVIFIVLLLCGFCYHIGFNNGWYASIKEYLPTMNEKKDEEEEEE